VDKAAVVTGAGSGVGQAIALHLVRQDWRVAIIGRRTAALQETIRLAATGAARITAHVCDVSDAAAVAATGQRVLAEFGAVDVLVNAAGTNAPRRALHVLSPADYHAMIATNMHGAYYCLQAFLPQMRARGQGTVINIVSEAGKQASPKAGPAYVMSKFGLRGLHEALAAEYRGRGVRLTLVSPGPTDTDVWTPIDPDARPDLPNRAQMMRPGDVADAIAFVATRPPQVQVDWLQLGPV
jgi:NAD(P)-dependent dehydrogenase (short-subunit alcohol dehydrogenase family)